MAKKRSKPVKLPDVKDRRDEIKVKDPIDITKDIKEQELPAMINQRTVRKHLAKRKDLSESKKQELLKRLN